MPGLLLASPGFIDNQLNEVYARYLAPHGVVPPARSTVQVAALPKDALVEIELIAKEDASS